MAHKLFGTSILGKYTPKNKDKFIGKTAIYRSLWERLFMRYCDLSENVYEWDSEPLHIPYFSERDNKWRNYYPDFWVLYRDKDLETKEKLIEIKPQYQTRWEINRNKWAAAEKFCEKKNYSFQVMTEKDLFTDKKSNIKCL